MIIRSATKSDASLVGYIHAKSWQTTYQGIIPMEYLNALLENSLELGQAFLKQIEIGAVIIDIAFGDEECYAPIGYVGYGRSVDNDCPSHGEIRALYLIPDYKGKGYGHALFTHAAQRLMEMGYTRLHVWVFEENTHARRFYEQNGFIPSGKSKPWTVMGRTLNELLYVWIP